MGITSGMEKDSEQEKLNTDELDKLFSNIKQACEEAAPENIPEFVVQFMFAHYPDHLVKAPDLVNCDVHLAKDREIIRAFFIFYKLGAAVVNPILNAGYDTLDSLATLRPEKIVDIERLNSLTFLPGHKVRLEAVLSDIPLRIKVFLASLNPPSLQPDGMNPVHPARMQPMNNHHHHQQPTMPSYPREMWRDIPPRDARR